MWYLIFKKWTSILFYLSYINQYWSDFFSSDRFRWPEERSNTCNIIITIYKYNTVLCLFFSTHLCLKSWKSAVVGHLTLCIQIRCVGMCSFASHHRAAQHWKSPWSIRLVSVHELQMSNPEHLFSSFLSGLISVVKVCDLLYNTHGDAHWIEMFLAT